MAGQHLIEEGHVGASQVPDVLAMDNVPVGTGASIVVGVAAAIALVLTLLVATLSSVVSASAMPMAAPARDAVRSEVIRAAFAPNAVPATYRITDVLPARDGTFAVVSEPRTDASIAPIVIGGLLLLTLAAGTHPSAASTPHRVPSARAGRLARPSRRADVDHTRRGLNSSGNSDIGSAFR